MVVLIKKNLLNILLVLRLELFFFFLLWDTFSIERMIEDKMVCSRFMESGAGE
jgi:hypothetical protein